MIRLQPPARPPALHASSASGLASLSASAGLAIAVEVAEDTEKDLLDDKRALIRLRRFYGEMARHDKLTLAERQDPPDKRRAVRRRLRELYQDAVERPSVTIRSASASAGACASSVVPLVRRARRELARDQKGKGKGDGEDALTEDELRRMLYEFTTGLHGVIGQYAGNVADRPPTSASWPRTRRCSARAARAGESLAEFTGSVRHPERVSMPEGTALLHGYGF